MDAVRFIQKFAKRNKKLFVTFSCFMLAFFIELMVAYVTQISRVIETTESTVRTNTVKIANIEKNVALYNGVFRSVVTRESFNDYVRHTDDRFKETQADETKVFRDVGTLDGRITGVEKIVYALNLFEIKKQLPTYKGDK